MSPEKITELGHWAAVIAMVGATLRWLYRKVRNSEIEQNFVRDMAQNHLPHIYSTLELIAEYLGVKVEKSPPIQFVKLQDKREE